MCNKKYMKNGGCDTVYEFAGCQVQWDKHRLQPQWMHRECVLSTNRRHRPSGKQCLHANVCGVLLLQPVSITTNSPFGTSVGQGLLWHHFLVNQCTQRTCWLQRLFLVSANPGTFLGGYTVTEKNLRQPFFEVWQPLEVAGFTDLRWPFMLYLEYFRIFLSFFQTSG